MVGVIAVGEMLVLIECVFGRMPIIKIQKLSCQTFLSFHQYNQAATTLSHHHRGILILRPPPSKITSKQQQRNPAPQPRPTNQPEDSASVSTGSTATTGRTAPGRDCGAWNAVAAAAPALPSKLTNAVLLQAGVVVVCGSSSLPLAGLYGQRPIRHCASPSPAFPGRKIRSNCAIAIMAEGPIRTFRR